MKQSKAKSLTDLKEIAENNGGKLISSQWLGRDVPHLFEFVDGREFEILPSKLKRYGWPKDLDALLKMREIQNKDRNIFIDEAKQIAEFNKGKLLSDKWVNALTNLSFQLEDGRQFEMLLSNLKRQGWPKNPDYIINRQNAKNKEDNIYLDKLKNISQKNNGELLSTAWNGMNGKLLFIYEDGREFEAYPSNIINYGWPQDLDKFFLLSEQKQKTADDFLSELKQKVENNGGKLISTKWLGIGIQHEFLNEYNEPFEATPQSIFSNVWHKDRGLVSEPIFRQVLEHLFNDKFIKTTKILTPEVTGALKNWELDGYCEKLKIAFEYQGHRSHWDKTDHRYEKTVKRDQLKLKICQKLDILLITIPALEDKKDKWNSDNILEHALKSIKQSYSYYNKITPPLNQSDFKVNFQSINHGLEMIKKINDIAIINDGKLLSKEWKGMHEKYSFEYSDGTVFENYYKNLMSNGWPKDLDKFLNIRESKINTDAEYYLNKMHTLAKENGGKLLSTEWKGSRNRYLFEHSDGSQFKFSYSGLVNKPQGWPKELIPAIVFKENENYKETYFLEKMRQIANKNEGNLLSTKWEGSNKKYLFEDNTGTQFTIFYNHLCSEKIGWPINVQATLKKMCDLNKTNEERLNEMKLVAINNDGKLLSTEWKGGSYKYEFQFKTGENFTKTAKDLKHFGWPKDINKTLKMIKALNRTNEEKLNDLHEIAKNNKGRLLSDEWLGDLKKYTFEHANGNIFYQTGHGIKSKGWPKDIESFVKNSSSQQKKRQ